MTIVLGHRGGRGPGWPAENTLEAFARALTEGADGIELDARVAGDGSAVVFHDAGLERATHGEDRREVGRVAYADLPRLDGGLPVPRLADALGALTTCIVNVEIKTDVTARSLLHGRGRRLAVAREVARVVAASGHRDVVFSSFDPLVVVALAAIAPRVPRALLVERATHGAALLPIPFAPLLVAAHVEGALATPEAVRRLRRVGLRVAAWTVNDPSEARALVARGVAWLITDAPGVIVSALRGAP